MPDKLPFSEGASINRPPLFCGESFSGINRYRDLGCDCKCAFYTKHEVVEINVEKLWSQWTENEGKKDQYYCIAKNIITFALNSD